MGEAWTEVVQFAERHATLLFPAAALAAAVATMIGIVIMASRKSYSPEDTIRVREQTISALGRYLAGLTIAELTRLVGASSDHLDYVLRELEREGHVQNTRNHEAQVVWVATRFGKRPN